MDAVPAFTPDELTGHSRSHIVELAEPRCSLHREVVAPFLAMRAAARESGIDLIPVSSFRDFERQLAIWNGKCRGERELRDHQGALLDARALNEDELVGAILHWSALPGASRHHWGTDLDVIDAAAVPQGYAPQLVQAEYSIDGVFTALNNWLEHHAVRFGFFRPYAVFRGGVQPEPWHLSYAPLAEVALRLYSTDLLRAQLQRAPLEAAAAVHRRLPQIVEQYVMNVDAINPATRRA
jgi:LAS superfamily LD-carboxypeptidase LdcB